MKLNKYLSLLIVLLLGVTSCSDNLDKVTYHPEDAKASELLPIKGVYALDKKQSDAVIDEFKWGKMEFGYSAAVNYTVEVDLAGKNFENAQAVTSTPELKAEIKVDVLNASMNILQKKYGFVHGVAQNVEFRIKGSISNDATPVYSNAIAAVVTSYFEYPKVWVIGDYSSWGWTTAQPLESYNEDTPNEYMGWVFFDGKAANGFKITNATNWDSGNFGPASADGIAEEADNITLISDGSSQNITVYKKNYYYFKFDENAPSISKIQSMNSFGIAGSALADGQDAELTLDFESREFTTVASLSEGEIYFRADGNDNGVMYGKGNADGELAPGKKGINVAAGTYIVTVKINNPENLAYTLVETDPIDPSKLVAPELESKDDVAIHFDDNHVVSWTKVDFKDQVAVGVQYELQIALPNTEFANPITLGTTRDNSYTISGEDLKGKMVELNPAFDYNQTMKIDWRVNAIIAGVDDILSSEIVTNSVTIKQLDVPENIYIIGADFGSWNWNSEGIVSMIPVAGLDGGFWTVQYLNKGSEFKWSTKKDWGPDFSHLENSFGFEFNDNAFVKEDGLYMIFIDYKNSLISIEKAQLFGIGDVFGSWDEGKNQMTIEGAKASITALNDGKLRLYASNSKAEELGWWTMEFTVRDGKIIYRGNGGDIDPATEVSTGQIITLDFSQNTGSIK